MALCNHCLIFVRALQSLFTLLTSDKHKLYPNPDVRHPSAAYDLLRSALTCPLCALIRKALICGSLEKVSLSGGYIPKVSTQDDERITILFEPNYRSSPVCARFSESKLSRWVFPRAGIVITTIEVFILLESHEHIPIRGYLDVYDIIPSRVIFRTSEIFEIDFLTTC
jgi:hypothetical protein